VTNHTGASSRPPYEALVLRTPPSVKKDDAAAPSPSARHSWPEARVVGGILLSCNNRQIERNTAGFPCLTCSATSSRWESQGAGPKPYWRWRFEASHQRSPPAHPVESRRRECSCCSVVLTAAASCLGAGDLREQAACAQRDRPQGAVPNSSSTSPADLQARADLAATRA
jgi:hypothetical protein